jgi:hypothetical protein
MAAANLGTVSGMATQKKSTKKAAEPESKAAATDAERQEARVERRSDLTSAQRLADGEKARQEARAERQKIADESRKIVEKKRASA